MAAYAPSPLRGTSGLALAQQVRPHADDLGLHPAVDRAIFQAYEHGALAGASILVGGKTFRSAAAEARQLGMPTWLHLALVDSEPVSAPGEIPSLVGRDGRFPQTFPLVVARGLVGSVAARDLDLEISRQIQRFGEAGLAIDGAIRLDGHQHLHVLPAVTTSILKFAGSSRISHVRQPMRSPAERNPRSLRVTLFGLVDLLSAHAAHRLRLRNVQMIPCWGSVYAGHLTLPRARALLRSLPPHASGQLICHPGTDNPALRASYPWAYDWEGDLATILALGVDVG
ncbi:MAG: carbohydrate deacetylase [Chloroflexota bacterium]